MADNDRKLISPSDAAEWLGVSISALSEYRRRGCGPRYYQPEGPHTRVWYRLVDLQEWMGVADLTDGDAGLITPDVETEGVVS